MVPLGPMLLFSPKIHEVSYLVDHKRIRLRLKLKQLLGKGTLDLDMVILGVSLSLLFPFRIFLLLKIGKLKARNTEIP